MNENRVIILDRGNYTTCAVNLHGAVVTSWRINNKEQIFLSRRSCLFYLADIRGGIGIAFPQFGEWQFGKRHGFARDVAWRLESGPNYIKRGDVQADFVLESDAFTESLWNYQFRLMNRITLKAEELKLEFHVENKSRHIPFHFDFMQRALLKISDVSKCRIVGLKGCPYRDRLDTRKAFFNEEREEVTIFKQTDRVYRNVPDLVYILDGIGGRVIKIEKHNLPDLNLWNPWAELAEELPDLGDDEYKYFVSPESCTNGVYLEPNCCWKGYQSFESTEAADEKDNRTFYDLFQGYC